MSTLFVRVMERNVLAYRRMWLIFLTGFAEPVFYLLSIGIGVGSLVGSVEVPGHGSVPYETFVAPGLLAASAMNGSVFDTTFNFFFKYKYSKSFDAMLATPMETTDVAFGEMGWALSRGTLYATAFLVTMVVLGLVESPWAVLAVPAAMLIGFAFAGAGMAATTWMRSFVDFDFVGIVLVPLFLFSATFFPLSRYPDALQWVVRCTPLYQGVHLVRSLTLGDLQWSLVANVAYLAIMGLVGVRIASRRLTLLLQP
ncbi:MAG TPA: ABC transporter permease [Acidimicrobiia bacterium]|nr:ABC transporter permease [Acidimicrobiia bacterium]